jgi:hypothetical protein
MSGEDRTFEGKRVELATVGAARKALEEAFDYRGDVTLERRGGEPLECFVFDRRFEGDDLDAWTLHVFMKGSDQKITVPVSEVTGLLFSGKDTAHGKSFERWMEKYKARKRAEAEAADPSG